MRAVFFILFVVFYSLAGCTTTGTRSYEYSQEPEKSKFTKHYADSHFKVTDKGLFSIEMVVKEKELKTGVNTVDLIIHGENDRDVVNADITVTPWMPEMGHGVFEQPVITEKGGGLYNVENIILIMGGHWELRLNIKRGGLEDNVIFDFPDVKAAHAHKKVHVAPPPSELDLSITKASDKKIYTVSYESEIDPIPINKIHSWKLKVETADGQPVKGAEISLDGDMPEHGHGLPTEPEVTQELEDGHYLVEGMKFSMPGWWVMNFTITTQKKEDKVTFNLFLK